MTALTLAELLLVFLPFLLSLAGQATMPKMLCLVTSILALLLNVEPYRAELPFVGWLRTIVANVCYDELRRRQRRPEELVADFSTPERTWVQLVSEATPEETLA